MFRKATLVAGALSLVLMVPVAHAAKGDMSISLAGGVAIPMGDFSKKVADGGAGASMGFTAGPSFDYMITDAVAIGVDGSFTSNNLNTDERDLVRTGPPADPDFNVKYTMLGGGAHIKYHFPTEGSIKPYLLGGVGMTNLKAKIESNDPSLAGEGSDTKFGAQGAFGVAFGGSGSVGYGLEAAYHWISADPNAVTWVGVSAFLNFGMQQASK